MDNILAQTLFRGLGIGQPQPEADQHTSNQHHSDAFDQDITDAAELYMPTDPNQPPVPASEQDASDRGLSDSDRSFHDAAESYVPDELIPGPAAPARLPFPWNDRDSLMWVTDTVSVPDLLEQATTGIEMNETHLDCLRRLLGSFFNRERIYQAGRVLSKIKYTQSGWTNIPRSQAHRAFALIHRKRTGPDLRSELGLFSFHQLMKLGILMESLGYGILLLLPVTWTSM